MNIIKQQNQEAAQSYITAEEFDEFKKNILGTLFDIAGDITAMENKLRAIRADINVVKGDGEQYDKK